MLILFKLLSVVVLLLLQSVDCREHNYSNDLTQAAKIPRKRSEQMQIHLAVGEDLSQMVVVWSESRPRNKTAVTYGLNNGEYSHIEIGYSQELKNDDKIQYIHYVTLKNLKPNVRYKYRVGAPGVWSEEHHFKTMRNDNNWVPRVAIYGDLGWIRGWSIPHLIRMTQKEAFDIVFHIGDIAYEIYSESGYFGDGFLKAVEPIASQIPYMVLPGNHEYYSARDYDYGYNYKRRFKMPQNNDNEFYTFKLGKALFVAFNTEFYFSIENGTNDKVIRQKQWLEQVLTEANQPQNRSDRPWIIALGHRSLYCSTNDPDCIAGMTIDTGDADTKMLELEEILHRHGVDIAFWGHYHYYDRFFPVYNRTMWYSDTPYVNPMATVHIISGSPGMDGVPEVLSKPHQWSAFRTDAFGYTIMNVVNNTHVYIKQLDVNNPENPVIDSIWVVQNYHGTRNNDNQCFPSNDNPRCNKK